MTVWDQVLEILRGGMPEEDFRRWFGTTAYASDSGDQITVWVSSEAIRRHLVAHYEDHIDRAVAALGRANTNVRMVVAGDDEGDDEGDEE